MAEIFSRTANGCGHRQVVMCPRAERLVAWQRLASDLDVEKLEKISREVGLAEAIPLAASLLNGEVRGRIIVDVNR